MSRKSSFFSTRSRRTKKNFADKLIDSYIKKGRTQYKAAFRHSRSPRSSSYSNYSYTPTEKTPFGAPAPSLYSEATEEFERCKSTREIILAFLAFLASIGILLQAFSIIEGPAFTIIVICIMPFAFFITPSFEYDVSTIKNDMLLRLYKTAFNELTSNQVILRINETACESGNSSYSTLNSGCNEKILFKKQDPSGFSTNAVCYAAKIQDCYLYLLPDMLVVKDKVGCGAISLNDLKVEIGNKTVFTYADEVADSEVLKYTWAHTNKNGQPDRRYKYNPQLALCNFGTLTFTTDQGFRLVMGIPSYLKAMNFMEAVKNVQDFRAIQEEKLAREEKQAKEAEEQANNAEEEVKEAKETEKETHEDSQEISYEKTQTEETANTNGEKVPYCEKCGQKLPDNLPSNVRFCPFCGGNLTAAYAPVDILLSNYAASELPSLIHDEPVPHLTAPVSCQNAANPNEDNFAFGPENSDEQTSGFGIRDTLKEMKWFEWVMAAILILSAASNFRTLSFFISLQSFFCSVCGIACIFLTAKARIINFPCAILQNVALLAFIVSSSIISSVVAWKIAFWPLFFELLIAIISWLLWIKHRDGQVKGRVKVRSLTPIQNGVMAILILVGICIFTQLDNDITLYGAFHSAINLMVPILLMLRYREHYICSIIALLVTLINSLTYPTFELVVFIDELIRLIITVIGFKYWINLSRMNESNE